MNDNINLVWGVGALLLAIMALMGRRIPLGLLVRNLIAWAAIFGVVWVGATHRDEVETAFAGIADRLGVGAQKVVGDTVRIQMANDGHFWARVRLNGHERRMLIDSGATITAISDATATAAGIAADDSNFPVEIETANGTVQARRAKIDRLGVGELETRDLPVVMSPSFGETDVLGMNFLSRLKSWRVEGRTLVLEPKTTSGTPSSGINA